MSDLEREGVQLRQPATDQDAVSDGSDSHDKPEPESRSKEEKDDFLARLEPSDDPKHFGSWHKAWVCFQMALLALIASIGSSIISPAEEVLSASLGISVEATVLTVSLFVLGFALGPICWGPISEVYGRRWSLLPPMFLVGVFSIGSAVSKDAASLLVTRFFAGVFGSSPIANVSAALGDIYEPRVRGVPMAFMAACVVGGALIAPVVGAGLTVDQNLGWRCKCFILRTFACADHQRRDRIRGSHYRVLYLCCHVHLHA